MKVASEYLEVCERLFSVAYVVAKAAVAAVRKSVAEVAFCGRLGTCAEPPRIPSLCDCRRVTTREECRITVDFYRSLQRRRQVSADAYIPYRSRRGELVFWPVESL